MLSSTAKFTFMALNSTTTPAATPTSRRRQHAAPVGAQYYLLVGAPYYAIPFILFMFLQPHILMWYAWYDPWQVPTWHQAFPSCSWLAGSWIWPQFKRKLAVFGGPSGPLVLAEPNRLDASCTLLRHGLTCQSPEPRTLPRSSSIEPRTLPGCCSRILPRNSRLETKTLPRSSSIEPRTRSSSIEPRTLPGWPQGLKGHNGHCWLCLSDCEQAPHIHICSMAGTNPSGVVGKSA